MFYRGQPAHTRRPPRVPTIVVTPASEEPHSQIELEDQGQAPALAKYLT